MAEVAFSLAQSKAVACFTNREFRGSPMLDIATEVQAEIASLHDLVCFDDWDAFLAPGDPAARRGRDQPSPDPVHLRDYRDAEGRRDPASRPGQRPAAGRGPGRRAEDRVWLAVLPMFHIGGCVLAGMGTMSLAGALV